MVDVMCGVCGNASSKMPHREPWSIASLIRSDQISSRSSLSSLSFTFFFLSPFHHSQCAPVSLPPPPDPRLPEFSLLCWRFHSSVCLQLTLLFLARSGLPFFQTAALHRPLIAAYGSQFHWLTVFQTQLPTRSVCIESKIENVTRKPENSRLPK